MPYVRAVHGKDAKGADLVACIQCQQLLQGAVNRGQACSTERVERWVGAEVALPVARLLRQDHAGVGAAQRTRDRPGCACDHLLRAALRLCMIMKSPTACRTASSHMPAPSLWFLLNLQAAPLVCPLGIQDAAHGRVGERHASDLACPEEVLSFRATPTRSAAVYSASACAHTRATKAGEPSTTSRQRAKLALSSSTCSYARSINAAAASAALPCRCSTGQACLWCPKLFHELQAVVGIGLDIHAKGDRVACVQVMRQQVDQLITEEPCNFCVSLTLVK